jgi:hypothetical protein
LVIDSMPLFSWPSGAKHAGSLYGGSLARTTGGLNQLSRKCTAAYAISGAPYYNTFLHCRPPAGHPTDQRYHAVNAAKTSFYARAANRTANLFTGPCG